MKVRIPATLSQDGRPGLIDVQVPAAGTVGAVLAGLEAVVPGSTRKIVDEAGGLFRYVNLYVNGDDVRERSGLDTPVREGDEVLILPAISGG